MGLWELFQSHNGRPMQKLEHYFPAYERHFARFVGKPLTFWEIGLGSGGSVQMWKRYFGAEAQIVGIDIRESTRDYAEDRIAIRIGDQADESFLGSLIEEFGSPDAVLDDGSHRMDDVAGTFRYLYPRMPEDGVYMVEDMCCAYWDVYGGGLRRQGTFIERAKALVDELNAHYVRDQAFAPTAFTDSTTSICFYDSIVAFERGVTRGRWSVGSSALTQGATRIRRLDGTATDPDPEPASADPATVES